MTLKRAAEGQKDYEIWRLKVEQARFRYNAATNEYKRLLAEGSDGNQPTPNTALLRARQAESETLGEYTRVLRVFTDLILKGKRPEESPKRSER